MEGSSAKSWARGVPGSPTEKRNPKVPGPATSGNFLPLRTPLVDMLKFVVLDFFPRRLWVATKIESKQIHTSGRPTV